jgi:hypothetical protein
MQRGNGKNGRNMPRLAAYLAVGTLLLSPVLVTAVAAQISAIGFSSTSSDWSTRFTPAGIDTRLAQRMRSKAMAQSAFPFTPAGLNTRNTNILTVAVRADSGNAVSVREAISQIEAGSGSTLRLANSNYQLTAARGWQAFTLPKTTAQAPVIGEIVGKGEFRLDDKGIKKPSRFNTEVKVDSPRGSAPSLRGNAAAAGDYQVAVGGSFRVAKGVDVTAGVRYSRDSDRMDPAAVPSADSEAVYVGTKIKF